jgi:hypothetical protein
MTRRRAEPTKNERRVQLHLSASVAAAWKNVLLPWFQTAAGVSWQQQKPTLVVVPFRSHTYAMKRELLDSGVSLLGIRFVSPAELRELLAMEGDMRLPLREHLRLLLAVAAEECMQLPDDPGLREKRILQADFLAAKSVARTPDHLLRTIDQLGAAGWDFSAVELPALREVEARFQKHVANCGFELIHTADLRAAKKAGSVEPLFTNVLVAGFNGAHWPLWQLLRAGVSAAEQATALLDDPHDEARELDEAWVGTWEETFGEARPISPAATKIDDSFFTEAEMQGATPSPARCSFVVGEDAMEQAEAIALMGVRFLAKDERARVAIVFAGAGSLSRLVGNALSTLAIPHNDGFGYPVPGPFESDEWRAWLGLQRAPRVNSLVRFLSAFQNRDRLFPELNLQSFDRVLRSAHAEVLIDDLAVLQKFCDSSSEQKYQQIAKILPLIEFLPAHASLLDFLQATESAFDRLNWKQPWMEVDGRSRDWAGKLGVGFSRALYLRWLEEIAVSFGQERDATGNHPYARIHLLPIAQAQGQEWSHLIFAGFNEGSWPPAEKGEFAREEEIQKFNHGIRQLNRRSARRGSQGEGHTSVCEGHSLYLGPSEQRQIALRQFHTLLESASNGVVFGASLVQEDAPERLWNPSELFTRLYQEVHHSPLTQRAMSRLQEQTRAWLDESSDGKKPVASPKTEPMRIAYDTRRNPNLSSGEYDFAFRSKPSVVPTLSVSDFEQLIAAPAIVWLKKYLGIKAAEENGNIWNTSSGKWAHDWLAAIATGATRGFVRLPDAAEIEQRVCAAAEAKRLEVELLCQAAGKLLPDWWIGGWRNAFFLARALADKLSAVADWPWMATEWTIDGDLPIELAENLAISVRGRIDLLLARTEPAAGSLVAEELWIIDYKTGAKKALTAARMDADGRRPALKKKLLDGSALQLGLYALSASALGASRTEVSLLSPLVRQLEPQISGDEFSSEKEIFAELARMQQTGVFGMHGPLRSAYRFTNDYPLATLAIDPDILEQRWELTHPALVRDEEEMFW